MKKIIVLGVFTAILIIVMSSSASAVEYRTVIEQNTNEIISQETTVLDKVTDLIPTLKITHRLFVVFLMLKFIKLLLSSMKGLGLPIKILILKLLIRAFFNRFTFIRLIRTIMRTTGSIFGLILINILKVIRFPFKLISKSVTVLIRFIRVIVLLSIIRIRINHSPLIDISGRLSKVVA